MSSVQIGDSGLEKLKKAAQATMDAVPGLTKLLPFLELNVHQDYVVNRIRELSKGGAMSEFRYTI